MGQPQPNLVETVVRCRDLDAMVSFLTTEVGLRVETISPADDPAEVAMSGHGTCVRVRRADVDVPADFVVRRHDVAAGSPPTELVGPNGSRFEIVSASDDVVVPDNDPSVSIVTKNGGDEFGVGRAGMEYRDLLPDRWGGRFIASHIVITDGGDVADYVHFHRIRFQMIFVAAGWVDVVYEDQGEPFRMYPGDCVLQPPEIRHRVLSSSPGVEVIEVGCPALHDTVAEHEIALPTATIAVERDFGGQRFVRHVADGATSRPAVVPGMNCRDTGIGEATSGLAGARVLTVGGRVDSSPLIHDGEFVMNVVLTGGATLTVADRMQRLGPRDAATIPAGTMWSWTGVSDDFEVLEVSLPDDTVRLVTV